MDMFSKDSMSRKAMTSSRLPPPPIAVSRITQSDIFLKPCEATPSPMSFIASLLAEQPQEEGEEGEEGGGGGNREEEDEEEGGDGEVEDCRSFSQLLAGACMDIEGLSPLPRTVGSSGSNSSFAQRLASRKWDGGEMGMSTSGAARYKSILLAGLSQTPSSPFLTIPPGLSPTALLDSPVLLPLSGQMMLSPTTGNFPLPYGMAKSEPNNRSSAEAKKEADSNQYESSTFSFKPLPINPSPFSDLLPFGFSHQQPLTQGQSARETQMRNSSINTTTAATDSTMVNYADIPKQEPEPLQEALEEAHPPLPYFPASVEKPSDDGYNWRKYGQKQVKGSEYPRSYYKCTSPGCPVKKKVERSYEGQITEIIYKGAHNHPRPQSTRRSSSSSAGGGGGGGGYMGDHRAGYNMVASRNIRESSSNNGDNLSSVSDSLGGGGVHHPHPAPSKLHFLTASASEPSTGSISDTVGEDGESSRAEYYDDDNADDHDSKRRRMEKTPESALEAHRTIREPRVVVQTVSDVDILEDGYRWRKYGQKVVKGNPHPRSYYKCTNSGCLVRKQVERSSSDIKSVITTYEGKHNHDVPAARNSSRNNSLASKPELLVHNNNTMICKGEDEEDEEEGEDIPSEQGGNNRDPSRSIPLNPAFLNKSGLMDMYTQMYINQGSGGFMVQPKEEQVETTLNNNSVSTQQPAVLQKSLSLLSQC